MYHKCFCVTGVHLLAWSSSCVFSLEAELDSDYLASGIVSAIFKVSRSTCIINYISHWPTKELRTMFAARLLSPHHFYIIVTLLSLLIFWIRFWLSCLLSQIWFYLNLRCTGPVLQVSMEDQRRTSIMVMFADTQWYLLFNDTAVTVILQDYLIGFPSFIVFIFHTMYSLLRFGLDFCYSMSSRSFRMLW